MQTDPNEKDVYIEKNFFSQDIPVSDRTSVFNSLFFHYKKNWQVSFALMLFLSVSIGCLGLSEDSSATIIGAMIIAPLGQPIIAFGGAIALNWRIQSFRMLGIIILGTFGSLLISYIIGLTLPDMLPSQQMLIRTSPDFRDLGISVLAGAAGAYGYYRSEFSTVLSGVAIAVALVPPICTCGMMLEQGYYILAAGSFLLFTTNFFGITFSALLVFFIMGINHKKNTKFFYVGTLIIVIVGSGIILPLALNYKKFNYGNQFQSLMYQKAKSVFNQEKDAPIIKEIMIEGKGIIITVVPFPKDNRKHIFIKKLEAETGFQVFIKKSFDER
ncbi:uncharacterized hydrophobic domain-containing protein [Halpernia humi]|uniref:Uncharacterized hydrophobic domain-containing protein n=1 Tax=Halpernia humi TaxID=493375 RepID=A0A1H5ZR98_9FLAO|nr:DUF389 domain-containing protein [Halpernia humi]SEG38187.1 uncharacterized hydrophobic domain-containing protein [Halpernia humi]